MTQVAGPESAVSWSGTFGWILAPGVATGVLLAWAEYIRRTGGRRGWRWLALAPLLFASVLLAGLLHPATMFEGGIGGGAIGVPIYGMAGGYALSGRGPVVARIGCGVLFLTMIPIWALTVTSFGGPGLAVDTPRGLWVCPLLLVADGGPGAGLRHPAPTSDCLDRFTEWRVVVNLHYPPIREARLRIAVSSQPATTESTVLNSAA